MDLYTMVVVIVVVVMFAGVTNHWLKSKQTEASPKEIGDIHKRLARVEKLEERVTVLEKIVTSKKTKLADEIDSL